MTTTGTPSAIVVKDVTVQYRPHRDRHDRGLRVPRLKRRRESDVVVALSEVTCEIEKGQVVGIIGSNGAGKSTLLRVMAGTLKPERGTVEFGGAVPTLLSLGIGFNTNLSGYDNIFLGGLAVGHPKSQIDELLPEIAEFSGIGEAIERPVATYSSGMRSRLAFSIAVTFEPEVLLLDEVMAVGDASFKTRAKEAMESLQDRAGTVVMVTHSMGRVTETCDTAIWLDGGQVRMTGAAEQVVEAYHESLSPPGTEPKKPTKPIDEWSIGEQAKLVRQVLAGKPTADLAENSGLSTVEIENLVSVFIKGGRRGLRRNSRMANGSESEV